MSRNRTPKGFSTFRNPSPSSAAPALLEIASAYPLRTVPRDTLNTFVPDSQMMFHVLSICDQLMVSTDGFTSSCPAWLPIVSQLYTSVLWLTHILKVQVKAAGYGLHHHALLDDLLLGINLNSCMIPGPLVPFFQALTASNGLTGDRIVHVLPAFFHLWDPENNCLYESFCRQVPFPALLLDQLYGPAVGMKKMKSPVGGGVPSNTTAGSVPSENSDGESRTEADGTPPAIRIDLGLVAMESREREGRESRMDLGFWPLESRETEGRDLIYVRTELGI